MEIYIFLLVSFFAGYLSISMLRFARIALKSDRLVSRQITYWLEDHPYHFINRLLEKIDKDNDMEITRILLMIIGIIYIFIGGVGLFSYASESDAVYNFFPWFIISGISGLALYFLIAISYDFRNFWRFRYDYLGSWIKDKLHNLYRKVIPAEISEVKTSEKLIKTKLKKARQAQNYTELFKQIKKFKNEKIPELLSLRQTLLECIEQDEKVIQAEKDNGFIEGEQELIEQSENNLLTLRERLDHVNQTLKLIPTVLNHLSTTLSVIITTSSIQQVEQQISEVKSDLDLLLATHEEVAELEDKYLKADTSARNKAAEEVNELTRQIRPASKNRA